MLLTVCDGTRLSKAVDKRRLGYSCLHNLIPELYRQKQPDS